jgi:hypothetical protein
MQPASTVMVRLSLSRARTAFMRVRLSTTCVPEVSGVEPTARPVLPPCGTMDVPAAAQALHHGCHFVGIAGAHHGQGLAAHAAAPVLLPGGEVALGQDMGGAHNARRVSIKVDMAGSFR